MLNTCGFHEVIFKIEAKIVPLLVYMLIIFPAAYFSIFSLLT